MSKSKPTTDPFEYTADGFEAAKQFLIGLNKWNHIDAMNRDHCGFCIVYIANTIYNDSHQQ